MDTALIQTGQSKQSSVGTTWEKQMDTTSNKDVLEILDQNTKWWEQAAVTCERTAAQCSNGHKEEWELMAAVYQERAEKVARFLIELGGRGNGAHG
jgi:hypothetical protein